MSHPHPIPVKLSTFRNILSANNTNEHPHRNGYFLSIPYSEVDNFYSQHYFNKERILNKLFILKNKKYF